MKHRFNYNWTLKDANFTKDKGKVFSCFACGGGSTMGYKLAGFDVIGCNEIDPKMNKCYVENHNPKFNYLCDIRELVKMEDLPEELYNLDILDGSPPCSVFSKAGCREEAWGVEKKFREGQKAQVLDTLFFDFIELANKLKPKVVIAENVKGILLGNAIEYVKRIHESFDKAGYYCEHFLLNASKMGVPQNRERVFFICIRKDITTPIIKPWGLFGDKIEIELNFNEPDILFNEVFDGKGDIADTPKIRTCWENKKYGDGSLADASKRVFNKDSMFCMHYAYKEKICPTLTAKKTSILHFDIPNYLSTSEVCKISSFPLDYNFCNYLPHYICGMSVPPIMIAQIATEIYNQWLSKINK